MRSKNQTELAKVFGDGPSPGESWLLGCSSAAERRRCHVLAQSANQQRARCGARPIASGTTLHLLRLATRKRRVTCARGKMDATAADVTSVDAPKQAREAAAAAASRNVFPFLKLPRELREVRSVLS